MTLTVGRIEFAPTSRGSALSPLASFRIPPCIGHAYANDNHQDYLPPVVALSGAAGSGKSAAAQYLVESYGYTRVRFAGPLKAMMHAIGFTTDETDGVFKEEPSKLLSGKTPRHAMQTLGTEWGRKCISDDFWVNLWRSEAEGIIGRGGLVVVDDCRFPNEATTVRRLGGAIYRLTGRGGLAGAHESERQDFIADVVVDNVGALSDLRKQVDAALARWV